MKILALITARGGSKRIPGKNIRPLGGRPLIEWSIDVAKGIPEICDILVSTDDKEIADVARNAGALVPWLRPKELATDNSSSVDVALHALDCYENEKGNVDGLLLLQPTSPFRSRDTLLRGISKFRSHHQQIVVGISSAKSHPMLCFKVIGETIHPFYDGRNLHLRSQDLNPAYVDNGAFYLLKPDDLRSNKSFYSDEMIPLEFKKPEENIDIDSEWDWRMAEAVLWNESYLQK